MKNKWYKEGLPFECQGCGRCCTGCSGYVWLTEAEIKRIAAFLDLNIYDFTFKYVRQVKGRYSLIEIKRPNGDYDCVFLKEGRCTIYPVRPVQCSTFPWWPHNLKSSETWQQAGKECPGISEATQKVSFEKIEEELQRYSNP
ncbi:MAG: YkgJ family cysteine cluster protein [Chlamydiota bacterium]